MDADVALLMGLVEELGATVKAQTETIRRYAAVVQRMAVQRSGWSSYADYLQSDHWRQVRSLALERADYRCQICNSKFRLDAHHRTYERIGAEFPEDVTVLCHDCHGRHHIPARPDGSFMEAPL